MQTPRLSQLRASLITPWPSLPLQTHYSHFHALNDSTVLAGPSHISFAYAANTALSEETMSVLPHWICLPMPASPGTHRHPNEANPIRLQHRFATDLHIHRLHNRVDVTLPVPVLVSISFLTYRHLNGANSIPLQHRSATGLHIQRPHNRSMLFCACHFLRAFLS